MKAKEAGKASAKILSPIFCSTLIGVLLAISFKKGSFRNVIEEMRVKRTSPIREKIRTGENNSIKPLDYSKVNRSVESSNFDSKKLGNLNKYRRGAFGNKNNSQLSMPQNRYDFESRKSSINNESLMIIEDQVTVSTTVALNKKFDFKISDLIKKSNAKLKSQQRYKNVSKSRAKKSSVARNHNLSMISPEMQKSRSIKWK